MSRSGTRHAPLMVKTCQRCGEDYKTRGNNSKRCPPCGKLHKREYHAEWVRRNKEQYIKVKSQCYHRRKDYYNTKNRAYYHANKDRLLEVSRKWVAANRDRVRATKRKYRARRNGWEAAGYVISQQALSRLLIHHNYTCAYCPAVLDEDMHWDHKIPLSRGGSHGEGNLVPACPKCNLTKGPRTIMEWRTAIL